MRIRNPPKFIMSTSIIMSLIMTLLVFQCDKPLRQAHGCYLWRRCKVMSAPPSLCHFSELCDRDWKLLFGLSVWPQALWKLLFGLSVWPQALWKFLFQALITFYAIVAADHQSR